MMRTDNLRTWLEAIDEPIEAVVLNRDDEHGCVVLSWETAAPLLDRDFNAGRGVAEATSVWVWTATRVYFLSLCDGAEDLVWVPRNPAAGCPQHIGGG